MKIQEKSCRKRGTANFKGKRIIHDVILDRRRKKIKDDKGCLLLDAVSVKKASSVLDVGFYVLVRYLEPLFVYTNN